MRFSLPAILTTVFLTIQVAGAKQIFQALSKRWRNSQPSHFVTTARDGRFLFNGKEFPLVGTTAYWLPALNTEQDIDLALGNISQAGFNAIRIWAFNDVTSIPQVGTWFQFINNGTATINDGVNGLQKLDSVVRLANKHGIFLLMTLTNNWNPQPPNSIVDKPIGFTARDMTNTTRPRNFLSNDYGGMDVYVRELGDIHTHDQFYINNTLINAFENYTTQIVSRYSNSSNVLAWEIANDPRCNSTMSASPTCKTTTITRWHSRIAKHIKRIDPNHLVSTGNQGFFCADCPKLFQKPRAPPPQPSPSPGVRRSIPKPLTRASLLKEKKALLKRFREAEPSKARSTEDGIRVRGRWIATSTKRQQDVGVGPAFDGSHGVDSEDILSIPQIGFGSFQLFPDQNTYGLVNDPSLPPFNQSLLTGLDWIRRQADAARRNSKPVVLMGFGLVTQENAQSFVPFNSTLAPFAAQSVAQVPQQPFGASDGQRDEAYRQWISTSLSSGLAGIIQYQWGQGGLSVQPGTPVSVPSQQTGAGNVPDQTGVTPNDGYSVEGVGAPQFVQTVKQATEPFGPSV
ncbi:hypothetical protein AX17_003462 [Amanita inopinata Kibby_2008]|nr:hypothetical protein AX17_003462 [Amanita inopinata Kibby_2008]